MSERATEMLEALVAATEAAWAVCERDASSIDQVAELVRNRQRCFAQLEPPADVSPRERELASRLQQLDQHLLGWCDRRRREIAQQLAELPPRSSEPTTADEPALSDFA
ncbi:MAG: hypothetical protein IAG13_26775 [Deltaproteobacteria bacterium]|nr:hypothetical protein [Nannocystaceae bacterium]